MHFIKFETNYYVCNCDVHMFFFSSVFEINSGLLLGEFSGRYMDGCIWLLQLVEPLNTHADFGKPYIRCRPHINEQIPQHHNFDVDAQALPRSNPCLFARLFYIFATEWKMKMFQFKVTGDVYQQQQQNRNEPTHDVRTPITRARLSHENLYPRINSVIA